MINNPHVGELKYPGWGPNIRGRESIFLTFFGVSTSVYDSLFHSRIKNRYNAFSYQVMTVEDKETFVAHDSSPHFLTSIALLRLGTATCFASTQLRFGLSLEAGDTRATESRTPTNADVFKCSRTRTRSHARCLLILNIKLGY